MTTGLLYLLTVFECILIHKTSKTCALSDKKIYKKIKYKHCNTLSKKLKQNFSTYTIPCRVRNCLHYKTRETNANIST